MRLASFFIAGSLYAQTMVLAPSAENTCSTTSTTITCTQKYSVNGYPFYYMLYAPATIITMSNSGGGTLTWTAAITGALSTACAGPCISLLGQYTGTPQTSGTAPSVVKVSLSSLGGSSALAIGTYTASITFTPNVGSPQTITFTLNIVAASGEAEVNRPNGGYPLLCPTSTIGNTFNDKCTVQNPYMEPPAQGSSYTDPNFGATVKRLTPAGYSVQYGSNTCFSALGTYCLTADNSGFLHVFRVADCVDVTGAVGGHGNISFTTMSGVNDQAWNYMTGATLHRYNFITTADTTLANYAVPPYGFTQTYAGGTIQSSPGDLLAFYEYGATTKLCEVNIPQLIIDGVAANTNTWCRDISGDGYSGGLDWAGALGVDSTTGKYYVWLSAQPRSGLYSIGAAGILDLVNTGPTWANFVANSDQEPCSPSDAHCISSLSFTHATPFKDSTGKAQFYNLFPEPIGNNSYAAFSALARGSKAFRMAEEPGGGMYFGQIINFDQQPGSSDTLGGIVTAPFMGSGFAMAAKSMSATAANPPVLSVVNALSGPTHKVRVDGGTGGWVCANGYWTAAVTGTTVTLTLATCAGAGSFAGQTLVVGDAQNALQTLQNAALGQIIVIVPGNTIKQVAMHRSVGWNDVATTNISYYGTTTKSSLSRDGSMVAWDSNFGTIDPLGASVYIANTGLSGPVNPSTAISGRVTISGRAIIH